MDFGFLPDAPRARVLDRRMQQELGRSLRHIGEAARGLVEFDERALHDLTATLCDADAAVAPAVFGRYYELVEALLRDRLEHAEQLLREIVATEFAPSGLQVVDLGSEELDAENGRYIRMMNPPTETDLGFLPARPEVAAEFRVRLAKGLQLLDRALPTLAAEIRAIVRQIVIAGSDPSKTYQFDGGSHYQLWGALFLNGGFHETDVAVVEVLAHECAHSLLFGFCTAEPLVTNDEAELFASPLRADLRPMHGIYHATFVSARMHWAMSELSRSDLLSPEERAHAGAAAATDLRNFDAGHNVVREHAKLTGVGGSLMEAAEDYVSSVR